MKYVVAYVAAWYAVFVLGLLCDIAASLNAARAVPVSRVQSSCAATAYLVVLGMTGAAVVLTVGRAGYVAISGGVRAVLTALP